MLRCIAASVLILFLFSCQTTKEDSQIVVAVPEVDTLQEHLMAPAFFSSDSAQVLGSQLDSIFSVLHKDKGFNGTVLVTKYNQVIYKGAFGYADFQRKDTLHTQTAFQLASVSKQFTAMAIMMLKERGQLHYDDSVQQYIPNFPYKGITIRQLLTHRSGLSNYTYFSDKLWPDRKLYMSHDDVLNLMVEHEPQVYYQPDTRYDYSNTGYFLLAAIVEKVSHLPFSDFMQKNIFDPLEMTHTFTFGDSVSAQGAKIATGHTRGKRKRAPDFLDTVLGDKGIYSTVEDLYKWDQALYTQKLVSNETLEEAFSGTLIKKKKGEYYGFGWRIRELERGDKVVYHAGLWHGYTTYLLRNPKDHSALIVLSNLPNGSLKHLQEVQEFLYPVQPQSTDEHQDKQSKTAIAQPEEQAIQSAYSAG